MRYEHINRVCRCSNTSTYIFKGYISARDVRDRMDTSCKDCLLARCRVQCTCMSEWSLLTDELYDKRNNERD